MTLIAVPVSVVDPAEADRAMHRAVAAATNGADLIEWRFDALADDPDARPLLRRLIEESPRPAIVTVRATEEGGVFDGTDAVRAEFTDFLRGLTRPPRYVDWELASLERSQSLRDAVARLLASGEHAPRLIVSIHDFNGRPADLSARVLRANAFPGAAVVKIVWRARSVRDPLEAFELLAHRSLPMIALCMGEAGLASRVLAPRFGGLLTFASSTDEEASAPGQPTLDQLIRRYRFRSIAAQTEVFGVVGWPVAQSRGPALHNDAFQRANLDAVYLPLPVAPEFESLKAALASLLDTDVAGRRAVPLRGLSVTIPHKESLLRFVAQRGGTIDPAADQLRAANTLAVRPDGTLHAANTDAPAIAELLLAAIGSRDACAAQTIRILGSGGVARAAAWAGVTLGAKVEIAARNHKAAHAVVDALSVLPGAHIRRVDEHAARTGDPLILVNATPLGMLHGPDPHACPIDPAQIGPHDTVFDTVYTPPKTPLIRAAEDRGARCITGTELFLKQAALQFTCWFGVPPPEGAYQAVPHEREPDGV